MSTPIYLEQVRTYFRNYLPSRVATLEDPESYFAELAEAIAEQVATVSTQLEVTSRLPEESYLQRVGRLNAVRAQAQELALTEILYSIPTETSESDDVSNARDVELATATAESNEVDRRLEMEEESAEAIDWDRRFPHLIEEVRWMQSDHGNLSEEEKRAQLQAIFAAQDAARPQG